MRHKIHRLRQLLPRIDQEGVRKMDTGFKEVLQKIKEKTTYADFDKTSSQI